MNSFVEQLLHNEILMTALLTWLVAQMIKVFIVLIRQKRLDFELLFGSGGMPSSHSAMVTSAATAIGQYDGWNSHLFALATVVALVVMYDAFGVRRAAGKQAQLLNQIVDDIYHHRNENTQEKLKELLGHTPVEVLAGAILGIALALIL